MAKMDDDTQELNVKNISEELKVNNVTEEVNFYEDTAYVKFENVSTELMFYIKSYDETIPTFKKIADFITVMGGIY